MLTIDEFSVRYGEPALFGMVHLAPLPGAPLWGGSLDDVIEGALRDANALEKAGFDGLVVENFGDRPFSKKVGPETVAAMAVVVDRIAAESELSIGVNVLRNDPEAAIAVAASTGSSFIRVNVHTGAMITDQGLIEGGAAETSRYRRSLDVEEIAIFADLFVKHARPIAEIDPVADGSDLRERGLADALLLTGRATGAQVDISLVKRVREAIDAPIVIASGVSIENARDLVEIADGFIVGTSIKENGVSAAPVDLGRARRMVKALK